MTKAFTEAHRRRRKFSSEEMLALRDNGMTPTDAARELNVHRAAIYARCRQEGHVWPSSTKLGLRRYDDATFKRLWSCLDISIDEIAASADVTRQAVTYRAKRLGLPSRVTNRRRKHEPGLLAEMWNAGVRVADIARHFGFAYHQCVSTAARNMGLPPRERGAAGFKNGGWKKNITLEEFAQIKLAERMRADARGGKP